MSIILDALKKSERERQAGQVPGMSQVVNESSISRPRWVAWVVGLLAIVNAGGIGFWLYRDHLPKSPVLGDLKVTPAASPVSQREEASQAPVSVPITPPLGDSAQSVPPLQIQPHPEPLEQRPSFPMPEHLMPPANPPRATQEEDDPVDEELEAEGVAKPLISAGKSPQGQGFPRLNDLPEAFQSRIPSFRITMFAYSENPQDRFVIVNMKKLVAGDLLPGGVLLIEIRAENLVGELDGQKFLIPRF